MASFDVRQEPDDTPIDNIVFSNTGNLNLNYDAFILFVNSDLHGGESVQIDYSEIEYLMAALTKAKELFDEL